MRLDECCQIELSSIDKKSKPSEKEVHLCNFTDVYYNWNIYSSMIANFMIATASDKNISIFSLKKGDVVITKDSETRDDIGMSAYIYDDLPNTVLGYHCALIRPNNLLDGSYLNAYLNSSLGRKYFENQASGSGQRYTLTKEGLGSIKIPILSLDMQKKIGELFSELDLKMRNNHEQNNKLESLAKTLYDYWFLQFEFPNEEGKPYKSSGGKMVWNKELKREIPEGWEYGHIEDIISSIECGDRPSGGAEEKGVPSIGAEKIDNIGFYDFSNEKYISENYYKGMKKGKISSWDVLLYKDGAGVGKATMVGDDFPYKECAVNSHVFILRSNNNFYQNFLYASLSKKHMQKIMVALAAKAAQPGLNQPAVLSMPILIPSKSVLEKYNSVCDNLYHTIFSKAKENKTLSSLRDWLLPMLTNGQVTFKDENI